MFLKAGYKSVRAVLLTVMSLSDYEGNFPSTIAPAS